MDLTEYLIELMDFLAVAIVLGVLFAFAGVIAKVLWPEKPDPLIDLSRTLYPFTRPEEHAALEEKFRAARWWMDGNARARVNWMRSSMAARRCNKVIECDLYPKLEVVR